MQTGNAQQVYLSKHFHGVILSKIDYRQQKKRQFFLILRALMKFERRRQIIRNEERLQPRYHGYDTVCCFVKFHPRLSRIIQLIYLAPRTKPLEKVLNVRSIYTSKPANSKFCIQFYSKLRNGCSTMCTNSFNHVSIILRYFVSSYGRKRSRPKMAD